MADYVIEAHEAQILTAAVEVKTLTIRGKQMTLAVFRQVPVEQIVDKDGTIRGTPWGIVNYYFDWCKHKSLDGGHLHVVWQDGDRLKRACVDPIRDWGLNRYGSLDAEGRVDKYDEWIKSIMKYRDELEADRRFYYPNQYFESLGVRDEAGFAALTASGVAARLLAVRDSRSKWAAELERVKTLEGRANAAYQESYSRLAALPQLFISV